jgi:hypothetical protein
MWKKLLRKTQYRDKAEEISTALVQAGVYTVDGLENSPSRLGATVAGESIYSVIAAVLEAQKHEDHTPFLREIKMHERVTDDQLLALEAAGVYTVQDAIDLGVEGLGEVTGIGKTTAERIYASAEKGEKINGE